MPFRGTLALALSPAVAGPVQVTIEDVVGRRVRALLDRELPAGRQVVTWDGRDDRGAVTRPGVYLVRARTPREEETLRAVRVR